MRSSRLVAAGLASFLLLAAAAAAIAAPGDGLEGTNWKFRQTGFWHWVMWWQRDYLVFQEGNFIQADLAKRGFSPSIYSTLKTPSGINWTASLQNPQGGLIVWQGLRVSYWMTGSYNWTQSDGSRKLVVWKAWQIFPKPPKP